MVQVSNKKDSLAPAASRKWLTYGAGTMLLVIGSGLAYRQITGNTMANQRAEKLRERTQQELASKTPGNADAFSARLAAQRLKAEEDAARDAKNSAESAAAAPAASAAHAAADAASPSPAPSSAQSKSTGLGRITLDKGLPKGAPGNERDTDLRLDAYEARKLELAQEANRSMGIWESPDKKKPANAGTTTGSREDASAAGSMEASLPSSSSAIPGNLAPQLSAALANLQNGQGANTPTLGRDASFLKQTASNSEQDKPVLRARSGHGRYALMEGDAVPVVMRTDVSSDIGGPCRGQVERDVFDSVTGTHLLIPGGTRAICTYSAEVVQGQERLLLAFTRLIYPSGASVQLGAMQGADMAGAIGAPAEVNARFWKTFGSSFLVAAVTRLAESNSTSNVTVNVGTAAGGVAANVLSEVARKSLERNLNTKPELRVHAGDRLTLVVTQDMVLDPAVTQVTQVSRP